MKNVTSFFILLAGCYIATVCAIRDAHENNNNNNVADILYRVNLKNPNVENSVYNFQSVCEQLCGKGFGGPICGAQCGLQINDYLQSNDATYSQLTGKSSDVCPILCEYGLGIPNCKCSIRAKRAANFDIHAICDSFCSANIILNGCGACGHKLEDTNEIVENSAEDELTTPNWALLCIELCKTGDGGVLCKCDLPPFF